MKHLLTSTALACVLGAAGFANPVAAVDRQPSYCGQSWVETDVDNDGRVTTSEAQAAFAKEFAAIDANGDDKLSSDEYRECRTSGIESAARRMQEGSETGKAPLKERETAASMDSKGKKSAVEAANKAEFAAADSNKDDQVSAEEYSAAARKAHEAARDAQSADADPVLLLRRYVVLLPEAEAEQDLRQMSRDEASARSAMKFSALDKDGNDKLTASEWSGRARRSMSPALAGKHFAAMDENGDDQLTESEYRKARNADMQEAQEAVRAWDEPQTLSEGQASGEQAAAGKNQAATSSRQDSQQEAAVPVYIYRFHTM